MHNSRLSERLEISPGASDKNCFVNNFGYLNYQTKNIKRYPKIKKIKVGVSYLIRHA